MAEYTEINLFDYFRVIKKRRWLITAVTVMALLIASIITSATPEQYVSSTTLILPEGRRVASGGAGLASLSQVLALSSMNSSEFERPYQELLQSQLLAKKVAKILGRSTTAGISVFKTGGRNIFSISCKNSDRKKAALITNAYTQALFEYEQESSRKAIDDRIKFINFQLEKQDNNLNMAQQNLIDFQRANKTLSIDGEVNVAVGAFGRFKYDILAEEAELINATRYFSPDHPDLVQLRNSVESKKTKLREEIENAVMPEKDQSAGAGAVMSNLLEKGSQFYRLQKMVEVQRTISRLLLEESEKLKLEKVKEITPFQVVDPAVPARFPTIPNVKFNIFLGFILGLVAGLSLSFFMEYLEALNNRENNPLK